MPTTIGRYTIIRPLGAGGMAEVYLARDSALGRQVAVKVMTAGQPDAKQLARFMMEAQAVAQLEHPAIVPLYDYGEHDGRPFLVMRYMHGGSLEEWIGRREATLYETAAVADHIAAALDYAHAHGVIHRDVKPGNILFDDAGAPYLADFGIARSVNPGAGDSLTSTGAIIGTVAYMSPEQALGRPLDGRSDVYSLGIVLFEMLAGDVPYKADSQLQQAMQHISAPIPDIRARRPDLPPAIQGAIQRVLAKEPTRRYPTAAALATDLRRVAGGLSPSERRGLPVWVWLTGLVGLVLAAIIFLNPPSEPAPEPAAMTTMTDSTATAAPAKVAAVRTAMPEGSPSNTPADTLSPGATATSTLSFPESAGIRVVDRGGQMVEQVFVPAGSFRMGTNVGDEDERPVHDANVDPFWIDRTEVTNEQFEAFVRATSLITAAERDGRGQVYTTGNWQPLVGADWRHPQGSGSIAEPDHPVVLVTWDEATNYCTWAGGRLPTEAEWEYAARGPESLPFPWGLERNASLFNSCDVNCPYEWHNTTANDGYVYTAPVGSYPGGASWVGALDMVGNVWEWVNDWYDEDAYTQTMQVNPTGPTNGTLRVIRGVAWVHAPDIHFAANRGRAFPNQAYNGFGFRCAGDDSAPAATETSPPTPSISPTMTVTPESAGALYLEEFNYPDSSSVSAAYRVNAPGNDLSLSLVPSAVGGQAMAMTYTIKNAPPSDYVGVEADRAPMNWRGFSQVCLWVQNDGFNGHMVFQFREMGMTTWKTAVRLGGITSGMICMPLNTDTFWNNSGNNDATMDLQAIDNYAIYLGDGGIDGGTFLMDNLHLSP